MSASSNTSAEYLITVISWTHSSLSQRFCHFRTSTLFSIVSTAPHRSSSIRCFCFQCTCILFDTIIYGIQKISRQRLIVNGWDWTTLNNPTICSHFCFFSFSLSPCISSSRSWALLATTKNCRFTMTLRFAGRSLLWVLAYPFGPTIQSRTLSHTNRTTKRWARQMDPQVYECVQILFNFRHSNRTERTADWHWLAKAQSDDTWHARVIDRFRFQQIPY